jgi:aspartyl-tRNA(Asn)/glutamyl-tRNA(Gln) amidotransferase subunit A
MISDEVLFRPVIELAERIRFRKLSPVELTEAYLRRIRRHAPTLNCFATVMADVARAQARQAEAEIEKGRYRGVLHGIPYGAKDLFAVAGAPTRWGAVPLQHQSFTRDATVVRKLREQGAVLLGKLAMIEFAGGLGYRMADASDVGATRNPWNTSRWAGGSSSGSGAAVAGGLAAFALGTETWGSILCPSAFCGITGLRPTYGRVSRAGAMVCANTFDKVGPMARTAADCRALISVLAGADPDDPTTVSEGLGLSVVPRRPYHQLRGALIPLDFTKAGEPEVKTAFDRAVSDLRAAGLNITEAKLPEFPASEIAGMLITAEALSAFENFYRDGRVKQLKDPYAPYQPEISAAMTAADLVKAWRMRLALQERMAEFFSEYDFIVTPNFMSVAPPVTQDLYEALPYSDPVGAVGNACGLPAIALPCGFGKNHMPVGFQIVAAPYEESTVLDIGELYQKRTVHHREQPEIREGVR